MQELARRCDTLIRLVEKENEEVEAAEREERKKSTKKTSLSRATDSSGAVAGGSTKVLPVVTVIASCWITKKCADGQARLCCMCTCWNCTDETDGLVLTTNEVLTGVCRFELLSLAVFCRKSNSIYSLNGLLLQKRKTTSSGGPPTKKRS